MGAELRFLVALARAWLRRRLPPWLGLLLVCLPASAPAIDIAAVQHEVLGAASFELLEDPNASLDLAALLERPETDWSAPKATPLAFGYSTSAWWLRLRLENSRTDTAVGRLLEVASPLQDYVDAAWVDDRGTVQAFAPSGDRRPFAGRPVPSATPIFPLGLAPRARGTLYIRLATHDGLHEPVSLVLWEEAAWTAAAETRALGYGVCAGLLLVLLIYSAWMWWRSRLRIFRDYCGYLLGIGLFELIFTGQALQYLWPMHPVLDNQLLPPVVAFAYFHGLCFAGRSLQLETSMPRFHRASRVVLSIGLASSLPALAGFYSLAFVVNLPLNAAMGAAYWICAVFLARRSRKAMWTAAAWGVLLVGAFVYTLELFGVLPVYGGISDVLLIGVSLQVLLLGLSLADAAETLRAATVAAERDARDAQEHLATRLADHVRERTLELEHANRRLNELAITDALTGAFNRRHFNEMLEAEIARQRRDGRKPSLCLIDVDHFKAYNDRHGHAAGDAVLKAVADALSARLRRGDDRLYRVGGEEFAVILRPGDAAVQRAYIESLRHAVEALAIAHEGHPAGVVTASFGLARDAAEGAGGRLARASALYREADRLLYCAKAEGRNRVECSEQPVAQRAPDTALPAP